MQWHHVIDIVDLLTYVHMLGCELQISFKNGKYLIYKFLFNYFSTQSIDFSTHMLHKRIFNLFT